MEYNLFLKFFSHNHISIHLDLPIRVTHFLGQLTSSQSPGPPGPPSGSYRWCQPQGRKDKPPGMQPGRMDIISMAPGVEPKLEVVMHLGCLCTYMHV